MGHPSTDGILNKGWDISLKDGMHTIGWDNYKRMGYPPKDGIPTRGRDTHQRMGYPPKDGIPTKGWNTHQRMGYPPKDGIPTRGRDTHLKTRLHAPKREGGGAFP